MVCLTTILKMQKYMHVFKEQNKSNLEQIKSLQTNLKSFILTPTHNKKKMEIKTYPEH